MDPQDSMAAAQALSLQVAAEAPNDPIRSHFPRRSHRIAAMTDRSVLRLITAAVGFFAATNMDQARAFAQAVVPFISLVLVPAHPLHPARLGSGGVTLPASAAGQDLDRGSSSLHSGNGKSSPIARRTPEAVVFVAAMWHLPEQAAPAGAGILIAMTS
jgi:hypothetical protein